MPLPAPQQPSEGIKRRDRGVAAVTADERNQATRTLTAMAMAMSLILPEFTSDDLRDAADEKRVYPHHSNVYGAVLLNLAKQGEIKAAGFVKSRRASNHARWIRKWKRAYPDAARFTTGPRDTEGVVE